MQELESSRLWKEGPEFLTKKVTPGIVMLNTAGIKPAPVKKKPGLMDLERFSSLSKAVAVMARVRRAFKKESSGAGTLTLKRRSKPS